MSTESPNVIDGRKAAAAIKENVKAAIDLIVEKGRPRPHLSVIRVGDDPASGVYIAHKQHACNKVGIESSVFHLSAETSAGDLLALIQRLNKDSAVHGILLQLPLPANLRKEQFLSQIDARKDVDGLGPENTWALMQNIKGIYPCTPKGVIQLVEQTILDLRGKKVTVVGTSNLVGMPVAALLSRKGMTVTMCNSKTRNLAAECAEADLVVCATGVPRLVKGEWLKPGAAVVDVGISRLTEGEDVLLVGDFDADSRTDHLSALTPVPGGVGPMTVANLLENTLMAYELQKA